MKILQWNVNWRSGPEQLLDDLERFDADIMCLQEVTKDSEINPNVDIPTLIQKLGYNVAYQPTIKRSGDKHKIEGIAVFSKYNILSSTAFWVNRGDSHGCDAENYDRALLVVKIDSPIGYISVGSTHLSMTKDFAMTEHRKKEADRLALFTDNVDAPFILAGDFNAAPTSYVLEKLERRLQHFDPPTDQSTFPTAPFRYHDSDFTAAPFTWRIDYILGSNTLQLVETTIPPTKTSDHLPILSTIRTSVQL